VVLFQDAQLTLANKKTIKTNNVKILFMADFPLSKSFCPPSFPWPLAVLRLSFLESAMDLEEATCVYAVFMPTSFRIQRMFAIHAGEKMSWWSTCEERGFRSLSLLSTLAEKSSSPTSTKVVNELNHPRTHVRGFAAMV